MVSANESYLSLQTVETIQKLLEGEIWGRCWLPSPLESVSCQSWEGAENMEQTGCVEPGPAQWDGEEAPGPSLMNPLPPGPLGVSDGEMSSTAQPGSGKLPYPSPGPWC